MRTVPRGVAVAEEREQRERGDADVVAFGARADARSLAALAAVRGECVRAPAPVRRLVVGQPTQRRFQRLLRARAAERLEIGLGFDAIEIQALPRRLLRGSGTLV